MKKEKRVAIYARVSTVNGQTTESQLLDLREYADRRGWSVYQEFVDDGVSGKKDSRPALNELMEDARKRRFDIVLVWRFDRFARSTQHLINSLEEFQSIGTDFVSYQENIDTSTPMGKMVFTVLAAVGELEHSIIVERVKMGLRRARQQGQVLGRPSSKLDLEKAHDLKNQGLSYREIAKDLGVNVATLHRRMVAAS